MIVTCPDCDTSFQLDESRIPQKGIRVRCSRCKHAFHLAHPSTSRSEAIDAVAAEAVTGQGASSPSVTQDLVDPHGASSAGAPRDEINNEDAAEWEFNEDIPSSEGEGAGEDESFFGETDGDVGSGLDLGGNEQESGIDLAGDDPASGVDLAGDAAETGLDLAGDAPTPDLDTAPEPAEGSASPAMEEPAAAAVPSTPEPAVETEPSVSIGADGDAPAAGGDAGQAFGSVDDFSSLMDDDPLDAIAAPQADHTADELRAQAAEQDSVYADDGQVDELGDPEKWDFFDGEAAAAPAPQAAIGRVALKPAGSVATDELTKDWSHAPVADPTEKGRLAHLLESSGRIVGWTVVIVGFVLGLASGLWVTAESFVAGERVTPIGPLEAVDMRAHWVDTARAGRLLVVTGGLRNPTRAPAPMPGPLEIALLDRLGDRLDLPPVSAGVTLSERQLRELPEEVLTRVRTQAAFELQSASVPAGGQLPFQVLIFDAPTSGLRFEARLAESGELSLPQPAVAEPEPELAQEESATDGETGEVALDLEPAPAGEIDAAEPTPSQAEPLDAATAAPGYDDPYGEDTGMGLQDL